MLLSVLSTLPLSFSVLTFSFVILSSDGTENSYELLPRRQVIINSEPIKSPIKCSQALNVPSGSSHTWEHEFVNDKGRALPTHKWR